MRTRLLLLVFALLLVASLVTLTACGDLGGWMPSDTPSDNPGDNSGENGDGGDVGDSGNVGDNGGDNGGEGDGGNSGDNGDKTPPEPTYVKVTLKNETKGWKVGELRVEKGTALSSDDIKNLKELIDPYGGYRFASWHDSTGFPIDTSAVIDSDVTYYGKRDNLAGVDVTWEFDSDKNELVIKGNGPMYDFFYSDDAPWIMFAKLTTSLKFEGNITSIGRNSFYGFDQLGEVKLPDTVERIGDAAFYSSSITDINFPSALTHIGVNSFYRCVNLKRLDFNQGLVFIGKGAFYECEGVENVILTDEIAILDGSAFYKCTNIRSAYYVGTSEQYENIIFRLDNFWVKQLANTYFLSQDKPEERGPYWYYGDDGEVNQWYYSVGYLAVNEVVPFTFDYVDPDIGVTKENVDFMNDIVYHGYRFAGWKCRTYNNTNPIYEGNKLTSDIRLNGQRGNICGDSMTWSIRGTKLTISGTGRMWDFETIKDAPWCERNVASVVIADTVEYIGSNAFCGLVSLTSLDIPTCVTSIHVNAFSGCTKLNYIYYLGDKTQYQSVTGLDRLEGLLDAVVYYKSVSNEALEGAYWTERSDELALRKITWEYTDGKLILGGDPALINFASAADTPWHAYKSVATSLHIRAGVTRVGEHTFDGFVNATEIVIPNTVMKIEGTAFINTPVYNEESYWESGALYISGHLIKVNPDEVGEYFVIKEGTVSLAEECFAGCSSIKYLLFDKSVQGVFSTALQGLTGLEKIYFTATNAAVWDSLWLDINAAAYKTISSDVEVYFYSKFAPTTAGNYWRYVKVDGVEKAEIWPAVELPPAEDNPPEDGSDGQNSGDTSTQG